MLKLEFCAEGKAFSDFEVVEAAKNILKQHFDDVNADITIKYSTASLHLNVRAQLVATKANSSNIVFVYNGEEISLKGKSHNLSYYPEDLLDVMGDALDTIVGLNGDYN